MNEPNEADQTAGDTAFDAAEQHAAEREQLVNDLAFLVACAHRRAQRASSTSDCRESEAK